MNRFREKYRQAHFIENSTCELPVDDPETDRIDLKDKIRDMPRLFGSRIAVVNLRGL
jgi:hypothetical protein